MGQERGASVISLDEAAGTVPRKRSRSLPGDASTSYGYCTLAQQQQELLCSHAGTTTSCGAAAHDEGATDKQRAEAFAALGRWVCDSLNDFEGEMEMQEELAHGVADCFNSPCPKTTGEKVRDLLTLTDHTALLGSHQSSRGIERQIIDESGERTEPRSRLVEELCSGAPDFWAALQAF
ncbi:hypothetical protein TRVL_01159 [Trypanosoma vivax]|nr:hypothetical protein TRVL_01159 [Trypanosoma vivax]